jgi:hypothetical protein
MQTTYDNEISFGDLPRNRAFRFHYRGESVIGVKAGFPGGDDGAVILTPSKAGLVPGNIVSAYDVGPRVVELPNVSVMPSTEADSVMAGAGNIAQPGELELQNGDLILVATQQGGNPFYRVNLKTGDIGFSSGRPTEIYSRWSLADGDHILYEREPAQPDPDSSFIVEI